MKKIAVIGANGYVGRSVVSFFQDHFELAKVDPSIVEYPMEYQQQQANSAEFAVICVPTPEAPNHTVDLSIVEGVLEWLTVPLILIKSTIPPGTTDRLKEKYGKRIVFSPEYIGEGKYEVQWWKDKNYPHPTDMKKHNFQIFGGDKADTMEVAAFFQKVVGPEPEMCFTDAKTAELCKYMENSWGATKVTFCNEFANMADAFGVSYPELRELWLKDGRVERMHTAVFPDKRGFGGKCYPKDVNGIVERSKEAGYTPDLLISVLAVNEKIKTNQS